MGKRRFNNSPVTSDNEEFISSSNLNPDLTIHLHLLKQVPIFTTVQYIPK